MSSTIDYRLAKRTVVRRLTNGELTTEQVCDAHPELVRASTHIGTRTTRACPVCKINHQHHGQGSVKREPLIETTWLYGEHLRQKNGHLVENSTDLADYEQRFPSFSAWTVECCIACGWNHLISRRLCGFAHTPGGEMAARTRRAQGGDRA